VAADRRCGTHLVSNRLLQEMEAMIKVKVNSASQRSHEHNQRLLAFFASATQQLNKDMYRVGSTAASDAERHAYVKLHAYHGLMLHKYVVV
jgi:hypothetical protein